MKPRLSSFFVIPAECTAGLVPMSGVNSSSEKVEAFSGAVVDGPWFVSIGNPNKLQKFLELNPDVPSKQIFIDDYNSLKLYNAVGFGKFTDISGEDLKSAKVRIPNIGPATWMKYATNFLSISPLEGSRFLESGLPEGGLKNGGTFVIKGSDVIYQWFDTIPGDYPNPEDVLQVAKKG
jgi:hypothetical protein